MGAGPSRVGTGCPRRGQQQQSGNETEGFPPECCLEDGVPKVVREASTLREKEAALEFKFVQENVRLKLFSAEGDNLARILQREDNSAFGHVEHEPLALPLDGDGFVQSFAVHEVDAIKSFFDRYGLVVVSDAVDAEGCRRSVDEVWDFLEDECKGLKREDATTWETWPRLWRLGILGNSFLLSPQFCENRQAPKVHEAFAAVFGTARLVVNVGRASTMRPTRRVPQRRQVDGEMEYAEKPEWRSEEGQKWLHWDMNPFNGFASTFSWKVRDIFANRTFARLRVQGILALSDCRAEDGGFFCIPGSHRVIRGWAHLNRAAVRDARIAMPESSLQLYLPPDDALKNSAQKAPIRQGSLLIWDARLAHCNYPNDSENMRIVQYIQMAEADDPALGPLCTEEAYLPPSSQFSLTERGRKLYGFRAWD